MSCIDKSYVLEDDGQRMLFGYKQLGEGATDLIYCLRTECTPGGPKLTYHNRVLQLRNSFFLGARDENTLLHVQPEALERMHGHCIITRYTDSRGRAITNKILFGKKVINNEWVEGMYMLGFTTIRGELTCYHSFFKRKKFGMCLEDLSLDVSPDDKELFEKMLNALAV